MPSSDEFRDAMSHVPTAVTVVAAIDEGLPSGATANAVVALSLDPLLMLVSLHRGSRTLGAIGRNGRFAINVLAADQRELAERFSSRADPELKWEGVGWRDGDGAPWLDGALVTITCDHHASHDGGDHIIVTGRVVSLDSRDGSPLLFHRGAYPSLG